MKFSVLTLFPDLIGSAKSFGLLGAAGTKGLVEIETINPRVYTDDVHQTVDDRVFGGGDGMAMKVEPLARAVRALRENSPTVRIVVLTPQGRAWNQSRARGWAEEGGHVALVCGRYAGIDQRFSALYADEEISLGDFVLNGGEIAALAIMESVARLLPGALGNSKSREVDSFSKGLLETPQFTRPREVEGLPVPAPLLSGDHAKIRAFEHAAALVRTILLRPDLVGQSREAVPKVDADERRAACAMMLKLDDAELRAMGLERSLIEGIAR